MLMIGSAELAERMYTEWKRGMDRQYPITDTALVLNDKARPVPRNRIGPRPKWKHLTSTEQGIWRDVAREISGVLADAMGAA